VRPTKAELEHELAPAAGQSKSSLEQYGVYFTRLKTYLSMTDPKRLQGDDGEKEAATLTEAWARVLGVTAPADKNALKLHVVSYVDMVARGLAPPWTPDMALVARVRAVLAQTSRLDRDYSALVHDANTNIAPISHAGIFRGSSFAEFVSTHAVPETLVPGAFTRVGWESYVRDALQDETRAKKLARDRWVLGESEEQGEKEIKSELTALQKRYFDEYTTSWKVFVADIQIKRPDNDAQAIQELSSMSESPWPLAMLLEMLAENTRLQPSPESALMNRGAGALVRAIGTATAGAASAASSAGIKAPTINTGPWRSPVQDQFDKLVVFGRPLDIEEAGKATGLSHYIEEIVSKLLTVLTDARDMPVNKPTPKMIQTAYETAQRATNELLDSTQGGPTGFTRPLLAPLLLQPVTKQ
jgi:type VI protein secretion system component VasK